MAPPEQPIPPAEEFQIRCPRLGHQIGFAYCRTENRGLPCFKSLDCWYAYFDVFGYLRRQLTRDQWRQAFSTSNKNKVGSLLELIAAVQQREKPEE